MGSSSRLSVVGTAEFVKSDTRAFLAPMLRLFDYAAELAVPRSTFLARMTPALVRFAIVFCPG